MTFDTTLLNNVLNKVNSLIDRLEQTQPILNNQLQDTDCFALRWDRTKGLTPIHWVCPVSPDMLLHVDRQAKLLLANTQQFVAGLPANNALLWGARGTGKSSLLQAVLGHFSADQLRVIELTHQGFNDWADIIEWIRLQSEQRFIIYCDDLSFNDNDAQYREIKAALDGSLMSLPMNALLYASSNRRHLLPEKLADNREVQHRDGEIHPGETIEETLSLSDRFGLWLSFHALTQDQYLDIVAHWLKSYGIDTAVDNYRELALRWALQRGSRSGRIANQFARDYAGQQLLQQQTDQSKR